MIGDVTQAGYLGPWLWKAAVEKAKSFDVDKVVAESPGIELTTAPEGYVKVDATTICGASRASPWACRTPRSRWCPSRLR